MQTHIYGKKHFKHKTNFDDLVVFSDTKQQKIKETKEASPNIFIEIEKGVQTPNKWFLHLNSEISGEYGDFFIKENPEPFGIAKNIEYEKTNENIDFFQKYVIGGNDELDIPYYKINEKFHIKLSKEILLDEVFITIKKTSKNTKKPQNVISIEYDAFVTLFVSEDGAQLEHAYQNITNINAHEVAIFIETNGGSNAFGTVFRVKKGANVKTLPETDRVRVAQIARAYGVDVITNELSSMLQLELQNQDSWFYFLLSKTITEGGKVVRWSADTALTTVSDGIKYISKEIEGLKIDDNRWKTTIDGKENSKFNPLLPKLTTNDSLAIEAFSNKIYKNYFANLEPKIATVTKTLNEHSFLKKIIRFDVNIITKVLHNIPEILKSFFETVQNHLTQLYNFINGLLVGLINSLIDFIKSIFDILAMLFDLINGLIKSTKFFENPGSYLSMFTEGIENIMDTIANTFTFDNLKKFVAFIANLPKQAFSAIQNLINNPIDTNIDTGALGYYLGYSVGFIASEVVTFFLTGGTGNIAKGIKAVFQSYKELAKITGRAIKKTVTFGPEIFIKLVKNILEFSKNIPKHLDTLKGWIDEFIESLAKLTKVFSDELVVLYEKFGITIKKIPKPPVLASGIPIPIGDDFYALVKKGKVIFKGSKKEVEELADHLKNIDEKDVEKYLKELPNLIKKAKLFNFKRKKILDFYLGENKGGYKSWTGGPKVKYLNESEKLKHQLFIKDGKLYNTNGKPFNSLDLDNRYNNGKAIFVMDEYGRIFASTKNSPMKFHHSSFLAGKPVAIAGEIEVIEGVIIGINNRSGHYKPEERFLTQFMNFLRKSGIDVTVIDNNLIK